MKRTIKTGQIISRDYGLTMKTAGGKVFMSPAKYALGVVMLETREKLKDRITAKAEELGLRPSELESELREGVSRANGSTNLLDFSGRTVVSDVGSYGNNITATILSKGTLTDSGLLDSYTSALRNLTEIGYSEGNCQCDDRTWNEVKGFDERCLHQATLETALAIDGNSRLSARNNLTGLKPKQRGKVPTQAFNFLALDDVVTDVLFAHFIDKQALRDINQDLLNDERIYSEATIQALDHSNVQFEVVRQVERSKTLTESEARKAVAAAGVAGRLKQFARDQGFKKTGYSLVFKANDDQAVAERFTKGYEVMEVTHADGMPVILYKNLHERASNWIDSNDVTTGHPLKSRGTYETIDDVTRRRAETRVLIPGRDIDVFVPELIKGGYV